MFLIKAVTNVALTVFFWFTLPAQFLGALDIDAFFTVVSVARRRAFRCIIAGWSTGWMSGKG